MFIFAKRYVNNDVDFSRHGVVNVRPL